MKDKNENENNKLQRQIRCPTSKGEANEAGLFSNIYFYV